ncbi:hypothetical protein ABFX02_04G173400 [Erythranthe guttata]
MAYAAVISLEETIDGLLNSSHISFAPPARKTIRFAYKQVQSLEEILKKLDKINSSSRRARDFDGEINDAVCKLEDSLESHVSNLFVSRSESQLLDLQELKQDLDSFTLKVKNIKDAYSKEETLPEEEEDDYYYDDVSSRIEFAGNKCKVVGFYDQFIYFVYLLLRGMSCELEIVSLVGMAGIGKSTLANEIFQDLLISNHFECRAWVRVGPKFNLRNIMQSVLAQVNPTIDKTLRKGDEKLAELKTKMYESLNGRRYLIVLDDVWKIRAWDELRSLFPDEENGSRIMVTTRLEQVPDSTNYMSDVHRMSLLSKEESWYLFRHKVFDEMPCPRELKKAGKKIAEICEGLPLTIVTVGEILSKVEKTLEFWEKVAEKQNSVFFDAYEKMSKVLYPSYVYLPQHLKACFLYMGVFPQSYDIPRSELIKLWSVEGFLESNPSRNLENYSLECLRELVSRNVVMVRQKNTIYGIKTCGLHSAFWHLCNREARKSNFMHVLNDINADEDIESQRRLCIRNSVLLGMKDVYDSMASFSSTARSLLCTGPPHQYPVPICFDLMLLRVLVAPRVRYYEFPIQVLKLVQLRYFALTYNGNLPTSISKLWNLKFLIIHRYSRIVKCGANSSYLPMEIWDMQELEHLQITGSNIPEPSEGSFLPNLLVISDISPHSCTKGVFKRLRNLKKLGIQIELAPDFVEPFSCLDHIFHLQELETLKCVIVNPTFRSEVISPPRTLSKFPNRLRKLTLSGLGCDWEEMNKIASLQNLLVLKLRCCAFRGPVWEIENEKFLGLRFLLIEDVDLVKWRVGDYSFPWLRHLSVKDCYRLEEIPKKFGEYLDLIEVVDCNALAMDCARQIKEDQGKNAYRFLDVVIRSSCDH